MPPVARVELWTDLACAAGTRLAFVPEVAGLEETRQLDGADTLTVRLRRQSAAWVSVREHRMVRVTFRDGSFDEWRITGVSDERGKDGLVGVLTCGAPLLDLGRGLIERTEANGLVTSEFELLGLTPSAFRTLILASAPTYFAAGTVDPTAVRDLAFSADTPLSALRELATLTGAELQVRRNGTTNYLVDLVTAIGSSAPAVSLRVAKNVTGLTRKTSTDQQATRIYGLGGGEAGSRLTIAGARWRIAGVAGTTLTLEDPAGGDGPLAFDDQLNGLYLREIGAAGHTQITDSAVGTQTVVVASAAGLAVGDIVQIERNAAGDDLTYLEDPASKALYGLVTAVLERQDIPPVTNLVANPQLNGTYAAGLPASWSKVGAPTTSEETASLYTRYGGKSCKVIAAAGEGLETAAIPILPTADRPNFSWFVAFQLLSGAARVELLDLTNSKTYPDGKTRKSWTDEVGVWKEAGMEAGLDALAVGCTSVKLRIVGETNAEIQVDGAQLTQSASQDAFYAGAGATALWQAVNDALIVGGVPQVTVTVDLLDLQRLDATLFPYEELVLGGTVRLIDPDLWPSPITTRILELRRDLLAEMATSVTLSNRAAELTDALVRPGRRDRRQVDVPPRERDTVALSVRARVTASDATIVTVRVAVADPYPQGTNSASIAYQDLGSGGVAPASPQMVTPEATLTEAANTYKDFAVTRPAFASGPARVTFTVTGSNRVSAQDGVDVPAEGVDTGTLRCRVTTTDVTAVANSTNAFVPFDWEQFDVGGLHSLVSHTERITIPSSGRVAGVWLLVAEVEWKNHDTGYRALWIENQAGVWVGYVQVSNPHASWKDRQQVVAIVTDPSAGDWYKVGAYQNSGLALELVAGCSFSAVHLW